MSGKQHTHLLQHTNAGHLNVVKELSEKADIDKANGDGRTPLLTSCLMGHEPVASFLLDKGADASTADDVSHSQCD